jgi:membrane protein DedA with SNARE-associated domain
VIYASLTGPLVKLATNIIGSLGLAGVAGLNMASGVVGVPGTEPTMLFAGFNVYQHHLTLLGIILAGLLGDLAGASIAYAIGFYGRQELLERHGAKLHLSPARLARANRWIERRGTPVILISRVIPFVRAVFPYAAGVGEMPYWRFLTLVLPGSLVWMAGLGLLGRAVGHSWPSWRNHLEYADYAAMAVLLALIVLWLVRQRGARPAAAVEAAGAGEDQPPVLDVNPRV